MIMNCFINYKINYIIQYSNVYKYINIFVIFLNVNKLQRCLLNKLKIIYNIFIIILKK